ncbi:IS1380 family transposase [Pseudonocardia sp. RS11V-5]|uniref:IS1380 family transposase n=1 Tax=Pseudonocardia terrae TaxID=2905831 RepID=UPI001E2D875D|nr:IS1380 family transposase [Pseudonocardia terrae]MCE3556554.1 IS1380 family transposase [Pseudonocardia terrae]
MQVGAPDESLTRFSGLVAVTELVERLGVIDRLDAAVGPIKTRDRGFTAGQVLVGMAAAQWCGEDFLVGLDRHRDDVAGQALTPVPGLASTTAAGLARRLSERQWAAVETGLGDMHAAAVELLERVAPGRAHALAESVTIDLDTTDVEVYGRGKHGVAFNHQGQRVGRPHVATWAEASVVLAADLGDGRDDPRATSAELLGRALAALPTPARAGRVRLRADAGYFAGQLARAALFTDVEFAIGARRTAPLWRLLDGVPAEGWTEAIDMSAAQVAVTEYCPDWWPAGTRLVIRRVRLDLGRGQVSSDPRARRRRTLHPQQRALPLDDLAEIAEAEGVFAYSFIVTNLDVSTGENAAQVEHWYRHRTQVENLFRDAKHGAGLRHLPSGHHAVNQAWMWAALLAATSSGWLHHLTAHTRQGRLVGHGVRGGQAMIATLRRRLIAVPARLVRHARALTLRLPPGEDLLAEVLARLRSLPALS